MGLSVLPTKLEIQDTFRSFSGTVTSYFVKTYFFVLFFVLTFFCYLALFADVTPWTWNKPKIQYVLNKAVK